MKIEEELEIYKNIKDGIEQGDIEYVVKNLCDLVDRESVVFYVFMDASIEFILSMYTFYSSEQEAAFFELLAILSDEVDLRIIDIEDKKFAADIASMMLRVIQNFGKIDSISDYQFTYLLAMYYCIGLTGRVIFPRSYIHRILKGNDHIDKRLKDKIVFGCMNSREYDEFDMQECIDMCLDKGILIKSDFYKQESYAITVYGKLLSMLISQSINLYTELQEEFEENEENNLLN